ncbi:hypothetical protein D479_09015 [Halobacillus sp. BAB-2008]|nr:hypothetical protein D479_09015 [Halobacillus sp. BAB-2008]
MMVVLRTKYRSILPFVAVFILSIAALLSLIAMRFGETANTAFLLVQLVAIPLSSTICLYLFYDVYEGKHSALLPQIYKNRVNRILLSHVTLFMVPLLICGLYIKIQYGHFDLLASYALFVSQLFMLNGSMLLFYMLVKDIQIVIATLVLYLSVEIGTFGSVRHIYHFLYFNLDVAVSFSSVSYLIVSNTLVGVIAYIGIKIKSQQKIG